MESHFDLIIVGNGIIGNLAAVFISQAEPDCKICIIGPSDRFGSASVAAGAMLNVFGEIDYIDASDVYTKRKIDIGCEAIPKWVQFLSKFGIISEILVADRTIVYKQPAATSLEKGCFAAIKKAVSSAGTASFESEEIEHLRSSMRVGGDAEFIQLDGEMALSTPKLFAWFDKFISEKKNLTSINDLARECQYGDNDVIAIDTSSGRYKANRVIFAAGSSTRTTMGELAKNVLPLYYGVGTAMQLEIPDHGPSLIPQRSVVRTANRGSTCGVHLVPRGSNKYYLGAGSFISHSPVTGHRLSTVKYLIDCLISDFSNQVDKASIEPCVGYRPISFDGKPMLGPLADNANVYVATGTKRDGLTYAPIIVDDIQEWLRQDERLGVFKGWEPDRQPISYGSRQFSIQSYVDNKLAGLIEHNSIASDEEERVEQELRDEADHFYDVIGAKFDLPSDFGIHPEILNTFKT